MLHLQILSGAKAGTNFVACKFPIQIGRSPSADLLLEEPGVYDSHCEIRVEATGFALKASPNASLTINGVDVQEAILRNNDIIAIGLLKMRFGLTPVQQRSPAVRETLTWIGLGILCLAQVALVYWMLK